jgi:hypothetical protein
MSEGNDRVWKYNEFFDRIYQYRRQSDLGRGV